VKIDIEFLSYFGTRFNLSYFSGWFEA